MRLAAPGSQALRALALGSLGTLFAVVDAQAVAQRCVRSSFPIPLSPMLTPFLPCVGRWGSASTLTGSHFLVHGGRTQGANGGGYTYTSGPTTAELLSLDLSEAFSTASPPWVAVNASSTSAAAAQIAPATAFHSISALSSGTSSGEQDAGERQLLIFGGVAPPTSPLPAGNDSAYVLTLDARASTAAYRALSAATATTAVAMQPQRRQSHSGAVGADGRVWLVGGERTDGSGLYLDEVWSYSPASAGFSTGGASGAPPLAGVGATGLVDAALVTLPDGRLLSLGGSASDGTLVPLSTLSLFDPRTQSWSALPTASSSGASAPTPRRGHIAVLLGQDKVFLHGGASADLSQAYADYWLLDLAPSPPRWSLLSSSTSASASTNDTSPPSARFSHSAVSYGSSVLLAFGWSGGDAVDATLHVYDASALASRTASDGSVSWSGGRWTTSYTPSIRAVAPPSSSAAASSASAGASSTRGSGSGSSASASGAASGRPPYSGSGSSRPSSTSGTSSSGDSSNSSGDSGQKETFGAGETAGAVVGALLGLGLIGGVAAFVVYRKRRSSYENWKHGDGAAELLGGGEDRYTSGGGGGGGVAGRYRGAGADDVYGLDKESGGAFGNIAPSPEKHVPGGTGRNGLSGGLSRMFGHAIEGSGPALREKFALYTGIGLGGAAAAAQGQARFDILADEDDEEDVLPIAGGSPQRRQRSGRKERSRHNNNISAFSWERGRPSYEEDRQMSDASHGRRAYAPVDHEENPFSDAYDAPRYNVRSSFEDPNSDQHATDTNIAYLSGAPSFSDGDHSSRPLSAASRAQREDQGSRYSTTRSQRSSTHRGGDGVKRSPTWWSRIYAGVLERSASGRLLPGPNSAEPIRDPTEPPALAQIIESPVIHESSPRVEEAEDEADAEDPFAEGKQANLARSLGVQGGLDELGRPVDRSNSRDARYAQWSSKKSHMKSLSSVRTASSSLLEAQLRSMDVVQRVRTDSTSSAPYAPSIRRADSERRHGSREASRSSAAAVSRGPSLKRGLSLREPVISETASTPGSVVWDPNAWRTAGLNNAVLEEQTPDLDTTAEFLERIGDDSAGDIATGSPLDNLLPASAPAQQKRDFRIVPSEVESITPATTKRARLNPILTAPVSPLHTHTVEAPVTGSVRERVEAFERRRAEDVLTSPSLITSPAPAYSPVLARPISPVKGGRPMSPVRQCASPVRQHASPSITPQVTGQSASRGSTVSSKPVQSSSTYVQHGLVPKAQLFVANPDREGSTSSR